MGRLTTHVLDTAQGIPAARVKYTLYLIEHDRRIEVASGKTNADGRVDGPLVEGETFTSSTYELAFDIGAYFHLQSIDVNDPPFLDIVTIRFTVADATAHVHVPLLVSPWAYSTYRGS